MATAIDAKGMKIIGHRDDVEWFLGRLHASASTLDLKGALVILLTGQETPEQLTVLLRQDPPTTPTNPCVDLVF